MLDEYWYYSLFTLFMLVAFESTVVWQRQRTLNEFRGMSIKPYDLWVFRLNRWVETQSDKLLPGDLVSVGRTKEDSGVACDMLLVEGTEVEVPVELVEFVKKQAEGLRSRTNSLTERG